MTQPLHRYELRMERYVFEPNFGISAYSVSSRVAIFPFGKKETYKTGREAKATAIEYSETAKNECTKITLSKMHGGCGFTETIFDSSRTFGAPFRENSPTGITT